MAGDTTPPSGATRYIETTRGLLTYTQLAPLLAERVLRVESEIASALVTVQQNFQAIHALLGPTAQSPPRNASGVWLKLAENRHILRLDARFAVNTMQQMNEHQNRFFFAALTSRNRTPIGS